MRRGGFNILAEFQQLKASSDYAAAKPSKFRRTRTGLYGSADSHYASEAQFIKQREYVRDMDRNDAFSFANNRITDNEVQTGYQPTPNTGDPGLDEELKADFIENWATLPSVCDARGEMAFAEMEWQVARAEKVDGDIFALPLADTGALQLVEAHRVRTPSNSIKNIVHGVQIDPRRRPINYFFCPDELDPMKRFERVRDAKVIPAYDDAGERQVFHIYNPKRVTFTRGITAYAPIADLFGMLEDTNYAVVIKQQFAACMVGFLKRNGDYAGDLKTGERRDETLEDSTTATVEGVSPGLFLRGRKGEELDLKAPPIPSNEYFQHTRYLATLIGLNLDLPLVVMMLDAENANFSAYRAAVDQAKISWRRTQSRRKSRFYCHVWRWRLKYRLTQDDETARGFRKRFVAMEQQNKGELFFRHDWKCPGWPYLEPVKDAQSRSIRLNNGLASLTMIHAEDGRDALSVMRESVRDNGKFIELAAAEAKRINDVVFAGKDVITWRDVLNRDLPKGDQLVDTAEETGSKPAGSAKAAA
jgi:lambda family phage portal protein